MHSVTPQDRIDLSGVLLMVLLTFLWGCNFSAIKFASEGISPVFMSLLRSSIASLLGILYCVAIKEPLFHRDIRLLEVMAAVLWDATTIHIKKYLAGKVHPIHTFLYQLVFSIPILLLCAYVLKRHGSTASTDLSWPHSAISRLLLPSLRTWRGSS